MTVELNTPGDIGLTLEVQSALWRPLVHAYGLSAATNHMFGIFRRLVDINKVRELLPQWAAGVQDPALRALIDEEFADTDIAAICAKANDEQVLAVMLRSVKMLASRFDANSPA